VKRRGLGLAASCLVSGCAASGAGAIASQARTGTPTPTANPADTKAADLRIRLDLLLGEHVMVVAKQAAAAVNRNDEYAGYALLLTTNGSALVGVLRSAFGNDAATQFEQAWSAQNALLADYTIGLVTHNSSRSAAAAAGLQKSFVPQFAQVLATLTQAPIDTMTQAATRQVSGLKTVVDDQAARSYSKLYADLRTAYTDSAGIGDTLATVIATAFPDKFPGSPSSAAAGDRVALNAILQEHSYLATMATDAAAAGRLAEKPAATSALGANAEALNRLFGRLVGGASAAGFEQVWGARDSNLVGYAAKGDAVSRQALSGEFVTGFQGVVPAAAGAALDQVTATIRVIDDQRARSYARVAGDDRAAAAAMQALADRID
jgi:hypothetical protein